MDIQQIAFRTGAEKNIFDSHQARYLTGGVTIDRETVPENPEKKNKRIIEIGEILGKINASGKYGPYDPAATDGRETARCILIATLDCTEYDQVSGAVDHARILLDRLPHRYTEAELAKIMSDFNQNGVNITFTGSRPVPGPKATSVELLPATSSVSVGAKATLSAVFTPINTVIKSGTFASINPAVATVDKTGIVTGVSAGTAIITFTTDVGNFKPTASVTVA